jgi:hypothetical protein
VLLYFAKDIWRILVAFFRGLFDNTRRDLEYRMGWYVIVGTIPIGVFGLLFKDQIRTGARNLWLVATVLIIGAIILGIGEKVGPKERTLDQFTLRDAVVMGFAQAAALLPGRVPIRRHAHRRPVHQADPRDGHPLLVPAGDPGRGAVRPVRTGERVQPGAGRRGANRGADGRGHGDRGLGYASIAWPPRDRDNPGDVTLRWSSRPGRRDPADRMAGDLRTLVREFTV